MVKKKEKDKKLKVQFFILGMFILTLLIGLFVVHVDPLKINTVENGTATGEQVVNPDFKFIDSPEVGEGVSGLRIVLNLVFAFFIAIVVILLLNKLKADVFLRAWFFLVVVLALYICFYAFQKYFFNFGNSIRWVLPLGLSLVLAFFKVFKRDILIHNITELFIYPGIALIFIPLLNIYGLVVILILISAYDMWAVWHSQIMQKMASYQIQSVGVFGGFLIPYASREMKKKIKVLKQKYKNKKEIPKSVIRKNKIAVEVAVLGGGDIVFSIISMGVIYKFLGLVPALFVVLGSTLSLVYLFFESQKKKHESYPAMPFITIGVFLAIIAGLVFKMFF